MALVCGKRDKQVDLFQAVGIYILSSDAQRENGTRLASLNPRQMTATSPYSLSPTLSPSLTRSLSACQVDTVENFSGLERLIVIAVGLDEVGSPEATTQSRARLYCALTRAQFFVVVVNEFLRRGCLEFLEHVELREDGTMDKDQVSSPRPP